MTEEVSMFDLQFKYKEKILGVRVVSPPVIGQQINIIAPNGSHLGRFWVGTVERQGSGYCASLMYMGGIGVMSDSRMSLVAHSLAPESP